jgi:tRNA dimethylallyltransferase
VGKSHTSLILAKKLNGEIINCDSMQVYKGFDIGTDKLPLEKRRNIPHHLLDIFEPVDQFTAADFIALALVAIQDIRKRERLPIITGGTGLYLKALLKGLFPGGEKDIAIRDSLVQEEKERGLEHLRQQLVDIDPVYAERIGEKDRIRIIRALEVYRKTGRTMTESFLETRSPVKDFDIITIGLKLERPRLYANIETRVIKMFENGLVNETKRLLDSRIPEDAPPFRALGYSHVLRYLKDEITLDEAMHDMMKDTRHYAKRQMTWFNKMREIEWFSPSEVSKIVTYVEMKITD